MDTSTVAGSTIVVSAVVSLTSTTPLPFVVAESSSTSSVSPRSSTLSCSVLMVILALVPGVSMVSLPLGAV